MGKNWVCNFNSFFPILGENHDIIILQACAEGQFLSFARVSIKCPMW